MDRMPSAAGAIAATLAGLSLLACSQPAPSAAPSAAPAKAAAPATAAAPAAAPAADAGPLSLGAINSATFTPPPPGAPAPPTPAPPATATPAPDPVLIRAEVLLDRARFSPGVIDGVVGSNERNAVSAYQAKAGLPVSGEIDAATWAALARDAAPVVQAYVVTPQDVAGPFAPNVGEDFVKLAAQASGPLYATPLEALAERFHMSQALLTALNPGADLSKAGTRLIVAAPGAPAFAKGDVDHIEVSKTKAEVTAFAADGQVLAVYPATVGSTERPSPHGVHKVNGVANNPDYVYDPAKLNWGPRSHGKLRIAPGPNNPVGAVWIDLNAPSYGIHGSPDPEKIGKTASHGCVRLTNWDALALAAGVKPGVLVTFVGARPHRG